ncbi:Six-hairpin glycosidase-like protein [Obelidium mucronatum]|nr:Six-hairpin glycosidase-like protein [Obelidium mucronatum]
MQHVVDAYQDSLVGGAVASATSLEKMLWTWCAFEHGLQQVPNLSGGLGEPKFNLDGSAFNGAWGRPQNDGPALRALAMIRFAETYLDVGNGSLEMIEMENLYRTEWPAHSIIKADLEYIVGSWNQESVELWEEVRGYHLYTRVVQRAALLAADTIHQTTQNQHWNNSSHHLLATVGWISGPPGKSSQLDVSSILGALHTRQTTLQHSAKPQDDISSFYSGEVLLTALELAFQMQQLYPVNHNKKDTAAPHQKPLPINYLNFPTDQAAPGIGRYPEDTYDGYRTDSQGNPWFLATNSFAELSFAVADKICSDGQIYLTPTLAQALDWTLLDGFFGHQSRPSAIDHPILKKRLVPHFIVMSTLTYGFIARVAKHVPQHHGEEYGYDIGSMSEQFNRYSGLMQGAIELTWSHASFLSMARQRNITVGRTKCVC